MIRLERILCPTDFSKFAFRAADYAVALGRHYDAEVHFLHVIPSALIHPEQYPYVAEAVPLAPEFRKRALERLDAFVALSRAEGVRTRFSVVGSWAKRRRMRDVSRRALPSAVRATGPPAQSPALSVALW